MNRSMWSVVFVALLASSLAGVGCRSLHESRKTPEQKPPGQLITTTIDYVDSDAFDVSLEAALLNRDGAIIIRTPNQKPDWTGRLNGWIAAWNKGKSAESRLFRGQIPVPTIDGDTLREFRLLATAFVDRAEEASKAGVQWWKEERIRQRRIELLRPYNLRFHMAEDGAIHVIFFHGAHSKQYPQFVTALADCNDDEHWTRTMECSKCKKLRQVAARAE